MERPASGSGGGDPGSSRRPPSGGGRLQLSVAQRAKEATAAGAQPNQAMADLKGPLQARADMRLCPDKRSFWSTRLGQRPARTCRQWPPQQRALCGSFSARHFA